MDAERKLTEFINTDIKIEQTIIHGVRINYVVAGSGPTVLLLHGANIGWGQWYLNIAALAQHFTVYAIDLPGAGGSDKLAFRVCDLEKDFVDIVDAFVKDRKLTKIHIVGHSFGGWIALKLALKAVTYLDKIVLVDSLGFTNYMPRKYRLISIRFFAMFLSKTVMKPTKENMKEFLADVMYDVSALKAEFVEYFHEGIHKERLSHPFMLINRLSGLFKMNNELLLVDQFWKIDRPTLLIMGEKDPLIPLAKVSKVANLIRGVQLEVFSKTGHAPSIEKSTQFNEMVVKFLHI